MKRKFEGIWIPAEIWLSKELSMQEKLFLVEIKSLDNEKGCYATNKYFAEFFQLSKGRVSQVIKSLIEKEYITVTYERKGKEIKKRILKIKQVFRKLNQGGKNPKGGYLENDKENNTMINNIINNKETLSCEQDIVPFKEIIEDLNLITKSNYKYNTKKTKDLIKARFNEGFKLEDFKKVHRVKASQWMNVNKMEPYLRPITLYGTKFESYLNESERIKKDSFEDECFNEIERMKRNMVI
jgi:uncharacterized phage protein (TIGR02220 family)